MKKIIKYILLFIILVIILRFSIALFSEISHNLKISRDINQINKNFSSNLNYVHIDTYDDSGILYIGYNNNKGWNVKNNYCSYRNKALSSLIYPVALISFPTNGALLENTETSDRIYFDILNKTNYNYNYDVKASIVINNKTGYIFKEDDRYSIIFIDSNNNHYLSISFDSKNITDFSYFEREDIKEILSSIVYKTNNSIETSHNFSIGELEYSNSLLNIKPAIWDGNSSSAVLSAYNDVISKYYIYKNEKEKTIYYYFDSLYRVILNYNGFDKALISQPSIKLEKDNYTYEITYMDSISYNANKKQFTKASDVFGIDYVDLSEISFENYSGLLYLNRMSNQLDLCLTLNEDDNIYLNVFCYSNDENNVKKINDIYNDSSFNNLINSIKYEKSDSFKNEINDIEKNKQTDYFEFDSVENTIYYYKENKKKQISINCSGIPDEYIYDNCIRNTKENYNIDIYISNKEKENKKKDEFSTIKKEISYNNYKGFMYLDEGIKSFYVSLCLDEAKNIYITFDGVVTNALKDTSTQAVFELKSIQNMLKSIKYYE